MRFGEKERRRLHGKVCCFVLGSLQLLRQLPGVRCVGISLFVLWREIVIFWTIFLGPMFLYPQFGVPTSKTITRKRVRHASYLCTYEIITRRRHGVIISCECIYFVATLERVAKIKFTFSTFYAKNTTPNFPFFVIVILLCQYA